MKSHFDMKRWAPRLALRKSLKVIRNWPITVRVDSYPVEHDNSVESNASNLSVNIIFAEFCLTREVWPRPICP